MATQLYVGNLPYSFTHSDLESLFDGIGQLDSTKLIVDHTTGRSKGFGFVAMEDAEEAERAISELNGKEIEGRSIVVNVARPKAPSRNNFEGRDGRSNY